MKILHIGDLHFKSAKRFEYDQNLVVNKLIEKLKTYPEIDFIFFTGDLVHNGSSYEDFGKAHSLLFESLITKIGIKKENIIICQGNHDINRDLCSPAILEYIDKKIESNDDINTFYYESSKDFSNSLLPSENFYKYLKDKFTFANDSLGPLYTIHKRNASGKNIGIVTMNSSWLSSGLTNREDKGNLLIPSAIVKAASLDIDKCDVKILLVHHPLHYLREMNYSEIEDIIHRDFHLMFQGHLHRERIETKYNSNNGIYCNTTQATLTFDSNGEIGFTIIDFDLNDQTTLHLNRTTFLKKENKFIDLEPVVVTIPCGIIKNAQNKVRQKITGKFNVELVLANQLLLNYDETVGGSFLDTFTDPILSKNSDVDESTSGVDYNVSFEEILELEDNYLLFGKDKCGKTSLLKKTQLHFLKNYVQFGKVPLYIDYKDWEHKTLPANIEKVLSNYYEINSSAANQIVDNGDLVLLLDNFNPSIDFHNFIVDTIEKNSKIKFIICSDYITSRIYFKELDGLDFKKMFFKDLTRKEIRKYAVKQPSLKNDERELILDRITNLCTQLDLPVNYWIVSLIMVIYKKSHDDYNKNLFNILDLCVDEILNKKGLPTSKSNLQFEQYKELCSHISHFLLINHGENIYSATHEELIGFIAEYTRKNPRVVGDSREIFEFLFDTGILKMKGNRYTFRLNGIFEYFLAYYLKEHPEFKKEILATDAIYLSFKNELEIYCGLNRKDEDFVTEVLKKTQSVFDPIINRYRELGSLDEVLQLKMGNAFDFAKMVKELQVENPLTHQDQDAIKDEISPLTTDSEVHLKELKDTGIINYELLEKYISILARVIKNSDNIRNIDLINSVFEYLLESYCSLGFLLIDEYKDYALTENLKTNDNTDGQVIGEEILKMIAKFIPVLSQTLLYDGIGHNNFAKIIQQKIDFLKMDYKNNQYKLFILYFLLIDLDVKNNKDYVDDVFEVVTLSTLKVSTLFKLNFYMAFKVFGNHSLEKFFRNKIQEAHLRIDNKVNVDGLQSDLAEKRKQAFIHKKKKVG